MDKNKPQKNGRREVLDESLRLIMMHARKTEKFDQLNF